LTTCTLVKEAQTNLPVTFHVAAATAADDDNSVAPDADDSGRCMKVVEFLVTSHVKDSFI
jgi:hypothetical protein